METLIRHLLRENKPQILQDSFMNCHAKGLHSIMFLKSPEQTIRLFVADKGNDLWKNARANYESEEMSVGFHPHHCNITLHVVKGALANWRVRENKDGLYNAHKFTYNSGITNEEIGFKYLDRISIQPLQEKLICVGESVTMEAKELHTVSCRTDEITSWFVYEGKEDTKYNPLAYSNHRIDKTDFSDLYQPMTEEWLEYLLKSTFEN